MKKIIILARVLGYGRIENEIITLANSLVGLYDIELFFSSKINDNIDINTKIKVTIHNNKIFGNFKYYKELFKDKDVIISTDYNYNKYILKYSDSKKIIWEHNFEGEIDSKYKDEIKYFDYVVVPNKDIFEYYENINKNTLIINNGIKMPSTDSKLDNNNIIFMGKLKREKKVNELIEVINLVKKELDVNLYIIGEGSEKKYLESIVKENNLNNIKFLGSMNLNIVDKIFLDSSLFVTCSESEYAGISIIEAMSYGIPIIGFSDNEFLKQIVLDEINGYLIDNRDKKEMKNKIITILKDKDICRALGNCAKEKVIEYDINTIKREWIKII